MAASVAAVVAAAGAVLVTGATVEHAASNRLAMRNITGNVTFKICRIDLILQYELESTRM
jgi:hypothetical protein